MSNSNNKNGGPGFPIPNLQYDEYFNGVSLRDYFAAKAMQGLIASPRGTVDGTPATDYFYAKSAYIIADAMLAEREK